MNKILKRIVTTALFVVMFTLAFKSTTPVQAATTVTITYNANGGAFTNGKTTAQQTVTKDANVRLTPPSVTRKGYVLLGYALNNKSIYPGYLLCKKYKFSYSYTLYAVWVKRSEIYDRYGDSFSYGVDMSKAADTLKLFTKDGWLRLEEDKKIYRASMLISKLVGIYGLSSLPNMSLEFPPDYDLLTTMGLYDADKNTIYINPRLFLVPSYKVNGKWVPTSHLIAKTIAHELRHAYQHQRARKLQRQIDYLYAYNLGYYGYGDNYIKVKKDANGKQLNYNEYQDQLVEAEAFGIETLLDPYLK